MAEFVKTYTADGVEKKELFYRGEVFSYSMIPHGYGKTSDKKGFDYQVKEKYPDESEYVIEALEELGFAEDDEIEGHLSLLECFE